jgi:soluble lytic murein transglycosylase
MGQRSYSKRIVWSLIAGVSLIAILIGLLSRGKAENRYDALILAASERYGIDPALIKAVIWQESRFNAAARGKAGEIGLMQVREAAAFEWADTEKIHPFWHEKIVDPEINILCGSHYLAKLIRRYLKTDNPAAYALADYNAGRTHVLRWNKGAARTNSTIFLAQVDYPATRQYALNVLGRRERYKHDFERPASKHAGI